MKKLISLGFAILVFSSCVNSNTSAIDNEKIVQQYYVYFNQHQWQKMAQMYSEKALFKDPSLGPGTVVQTRQQIAQKYTELASLFPDVHDSIVAIYPSSDKHIVVEFISTGTAPEQSKFSLPICTIFTIENGQITKDFTYYDNFEAPTVNEKQ